MSNPLHTPKIEAEMIHVECLRRTAKAVAAGTDAYTPDGMTPAYRRDVYNRLAKLHNDTLDKYGFDGMHLPMDETKGR